jgi:VWFA-related protein
MKTSGNAGEPAKDGTGAKLAHHAHEVLPNWPPSPSPTPATVPSRECTMTSRTLTQTSKSYATAVPLHRAPSRRRGLRVVAPATALLAALLAAPGGAATNSAGQPREDVPDLAGTWLRDEQKSDDLRERLDPDTQGPKPGVRFGGTGFGGRGRSFPDDRRANAALLERFARGLEVLEIEQAGDQVTLRNANRETRVFFADGRTLGDGLSSRTTAFYEEGSLIVETTSAAGNRTETFELDGELLVVVTQIQEAEQANLEVRTVYERISRPIPRPTATAPTAAAVTPAIVTPAIVTPATSRLRGEKVASPFANDPPLEDSSEGTPEAAMARSDDAASPDTTGDAVDRNDTHDTNDTSSTTNTVETASARFVGTVADDRIAATSPRRASGRSAVVRILPPPPQRGGLTGNVTIETLTIDPAIATVTFFVDDEEVARRSTLPYDAKIALARPPREQVVRVEALDHAGRRLGMDELVVNRHDPPFRIQITELAPATPGAGAGEPRLLTQVSVPRDAEVSKVRFYRNRTLIGQDDTPPYETAVVGGPLRGDEYLRAVAVLTDGREAEDVEVGLLPGGKAFSEELDVRLVELQVLVTDRAGFPLTDLTAADFEIVHGGKARDVAEVYPSRNVPLILGLAVDSSGSMLSLWDATRSIAEGFLAATLRDDDRAFLIDFDSHVRLLQPLTGELADLFASLGRLRAGGGTALYDSILFSLLQFGSEPGRRALIVLTDGFDSESRANPSRAVEIAERLGVPIYAIAMNTGGAAAVPNVVLFPQAGGNAVGADSIRGNLRLVTDPTGGRYYTAVSNQHVASAFEQIEQELREQYVVTFYTDVSAEALEPPTVRVKRSGAKVRSALPLER